MQLGRSYSRRLKSVKYDIYELYPSARHAYSTIQPAVKTSRPHCNFKDLVTSSDSDIDRNCIEKCGVPLHTAFTPSGSSLKISTGYFLSARSGSGCLYSLLLHKELKQTVPSLTQFPHYTLVRSLKMSNGHFFNVPSSNAGCKDSIKCISLAPLIKIKKHSKCL